MTKQVRTGGNEFDATTDIFKLVKNNLEMIKNSRYDERNFQNYET